MSEQVLIVGAGPTGMVLALWLNRLGVKFRILDKASSPGTTSRATAIQARTLELYRQLDLADTLVERGNRGKQVNVWTGGKKKAEIRLNNVGRNATPYPFTLIFPQDRHEELLVERLNAAGITIEPNVEVLAYEDLGTHISARYRYGEGKEATVEAQYIVGCDGAHSIVRKTMAVDFPGGICDKVFYVADVEASGLLVDGQMHIDVEESDFTMVMNYAEPGLLRLIGTVKADEDADLKTMRFEAVSGDALTSLQINVQKVNWFSVYRVHQRVASTFRKGRSLIAGDAGHIHNPAGGQGMNTGIGDAINLAWKLAAVLNNEATDALLDSYDAERQTVAQKLVHMTEQLFTTVITEAGYVNVCHTDVYPAGATLALRIDLMQSSLFHAVSQLDLSYRESAISAGGAGQVHGGERLPWVFIDGRSNYDALPMRWNVHVYGSPTPALVEWCQVKGLPLSTFEWRQEHCRAGLKEDAAYLLRPDTYVAFATANPTPKELNGFLCSKAINPKIPRSS